MSTTTDVNAVNHSSAFIEGWTDGAFPADVQPAPLWQTSRDVYVEVRFYTTGSHAITIDGGTNSNIGTIALYDTDTAVSASSPAGSQNTGVSFNTGSPGGKYAAVMGNVTVGSIGVRRLWFNLSGSSYETIKYIYTDDTAAVNALVTQEAVEVGYIAVIAAKVTQEAVEVGYTIPPPSVIEDIRLYTKDGKRKVMPREWITSCNFEYSERGGWESGELKLTKDFDAAYFAGTEYVEVWLWGYRMFRGWAIVVESDMGIPDSVSLRLYGLQQRLQGYIVRRDYCYPGQTNIDTIFRDIVTETAKNYAIRLPYLEVQTSVFSLGLYLSTFTPNGRTLPEACNSLCDMFPNTLIWGCDVDPANGLDRIYLRPRPTDEGNYKFAVGSKITGYAYPRDATQIANRLLITGGKVEIPNILPNASFETCLTPGELTTNELLNPSFEGNPITNWTRIHDPTRDTTAFRTGSQSFRMDNNPSAQETVYQYVNLPLIQPMSASIYARCKLGFTWTLAIKLSLMDSSNTVLAAFQSADFQVIPNQEWQYFSFGANPTGAYPSAVKVQVAFICVYSSGTAAGNIDDAAFWFPNSIEAEGWKAGTNSGASFALLDWNNHIASVTAFDGVTTVRAQATIAGGAGSYVEITSDPASHIPVKPSQTYALVCWFQPEGGSTIDVAIGARTWSGATLVGATMSARQTFTSPSTTNNGFYQVIYIVTTGAGNDGLDFLIRLYNGSVVYIDGAGVFFAADVPASYYPADVYTAVRDVGDYGSQLSGQAITSMQDFGVREKAVTVDSVVDQTSLDIFAINYLNAHAPPSVQARLDIKDASAPVFQDGRVKIINMPAATLGDAGAALFPSRIRYEIADGIDIAMDLNNERPDMTALLRAIGQNPKL